jgi:hypothetical protein
MSVSTEVQRTLVKSPPELWAELSSAEALARHLGDFGEIRITAVEPETKVEWEADAACGVVQLEQSGWGTRVTLSVTRHPPAPDVPSEPEPEPVAFVEPEPEPAAEEAEPETNVAAEPPTVAIEPPTAEPEVADSEPEVDAHMVMAAVEPDTGIAPEPELGFFARLFRKRKAKPAIVAEPEPVVSMEPELAPEPEPAPEPEVVAMAAPEPIYPARPPEPETVEPATDLAAELESVEAQMEQEAAELLTGVLDRLGAAHHRPFSRG